MAGIADILGEPLFDAIPDTGNIRLPGPLNPPPAQILPGPIRDVPNEMLGANQLLPPGYQEGLNRLNQAYTQKMSEGSFASRHPAMSRIGGGLLGALLSGGVTALQGGGTGQSIAQALLGGLGAVQGVGQAEMGRKQLLMNQYQTMQKALMDQTTAEEGWRKDRAGTQDLQNRFGYLANDPNATDAERSTLRGLQKGYNAPLPLDKVDGIIGAYQGGDIMADIMELLTGARGAGAMAGYGLATQPGAPKGQTMPSQPPAAQAGQASPMTTVPNTVPGTPERPTLQGGVAASGGSPMPVTLPTETARPFNGRRRVVPLTIQEKLMGEFRGAGDTGFTQGVTASTKASENVENYASANRSNAEAADAYASSDYRKMATIADKEVKAAQAMLDRAKADLAKRTDPNIRGGGSSRYTGLDELNLLEKELGIATTEVKAAYDELEANPKGWNVPWDEQKNSRHEAAKSRYDAALRRVQMITSRASGGSQPNPAPKPATPKNRGAGDSYSTPEGIVFRY